MLRPLAFKTIYCATCDHAHSTDVMRSLVMPYGTIIVCDECCRWEPSDFELSDQLRAEFMAGR